MADFKTRITASASIGNFERDAMAFASQPQIVFADSGLNTVAANNLGQCCVEYFNKTTNSVDVEIKVTTKIEYYTASNEYSEFESAKAMPNPFAATPTSVSLNTPFSYKVETMTVFSESVPLKLGSGNKQQTYTVQGNELLDAKATMGGQSLIGRLSDRFINNYKYGKKEIAFSHPFIPLENENGGAKLTTWNVGLEITMQDEFGRPLYYYQNTTTPKVFEVYDCLFGGEKWTIKAREIAL
jgi:hypothetical protein